MPLARVYFLSPSLDVFVTPREFIKRFRDRASPSCEEIFSRGPMVAKRGERVGVVLLSMGGAQHAEDVEATIRQQLVGSGSGFLRRRKAARVARRHASRVRNGYEQIGGMCPQRFRSREQASELQTQLNADFGKSLGVTFRTFVGTQDGLQQTLTRVRQSKVNWIVLVPLYPQYNRSATGMVLEKWSELGSHEQNRARLPSTLVPDYATHPSFLQAISERIDEALQRFPRHARKSVPFVFMAPSRPLRELARHNDSYNEQVQATARSVMAIRRTRDADRPFYVSFQERVGLGKMLTPRLDDTLEELVEDGHAQALVIPVAQVSDCVETVYGLDIEMREKAAAMGLEQFEVTSSLNSHPLFIETLVDCVTGQLKVTSKPAAISKELSAATDGAGVDMLLASEQAVDEGRSKAA